MLIVHQGLATWGMGGVVWLAATATAHLVAGVVTFGIGERVAKQRGALGR
ncbi:MAG: hypothetical protein M0Z46_02895 [Actinomycetota bacterium]|nr:hypothetical protein [Actinomycetota bacterium]